LPDTHDIWREFEKKFIASAPQVETTNPTNDHYCLASLKTPATLRMEDWGDDDPKEEVSQNDFHHPTRQGLYDQKLDLGRHFKGADLSSII